MQILRLLVAPLMKHLLGAAASETGAISSKTGVTASKFGSKTGATGSNRKRTIAVLRRWLKDRPRAAQDSLE